MYLYVLPGSKVGSPSVTNQSSRIIILRLRDRSLPAGNQMSGCRIDHMTQRQRETGLTEQPLESGSPTPGPETKLFNSSDWFPHLYSWNLMLLCRTFAQVKSDNFFEILA